MSIINRTVTLIKAFFNKILGKAETQNADALLNQYLADAKRNLNDLQAKTAAVVADEMAAARRINQYEEEITRLESYAMQAVQAGNDGDARKFLEGKAKAAEKKAQAEKLYAQAQLNSNNMKNMTQKLVEDIREAEGRLNELKSKLEVAKQVEKMNALNEKIASVNAGVADYESLEAAVQKRIDEIEARAQLNTQLDENASLNDLKKKYDGTETDAPSVGVEQELAALKARLQ